MPFPQIHKLFAGAKKLVDVGNVPSGNNTVCRTLEPLLREVLPIGVGMALAGFIAVPLLYLSDPSWPIVIIHPVSLAALTLGFFKAWVLGITFFGVGTHLINVWQAKRGAK